jgi:diguanylate cyclase (GGDEF)-like protein
MSQATQEDDSALDLVRGDERLRANCLRALLAVSLAVAIVGYFLLAQWSDLRPSGKLLAGRLLTGLGLASIMVFIVQYVLKNTVIAANLYAFKLGLILVLATLFSGGLVSPVLPLYLLLPMTCFLIAGARSGLVWSGIVVLIGVVLAGSTESIAMLEPVLRSAEGQYGLLLSTGASTLALVAILFLYQGINAGLHGEVIEQRQRFAHHVRHDGLTNLANRQHFIEQLELAIKRSSRVHSNFALLMINLVGFKYVNQQYGEDVGDQVLQQLGDRVNSRIRTTDCLGRWGGDEFSVILETVPAVRDIEKIAQAILAQVHSSFQVDGHEIQLSANIGAAIYPDHAADSETLINLANEAMLQCKENSLSNFCMSEEEPVDDISPFRPEPLEKRQHLIGA